jgi:hypothetical protein
MPEKRYTEITLRLEDGAIDQLKSIFRGPSGSRPISATQAVQMAIERVQGDVGSVKLNEPERREIESRIGATMPIRASKDILRAFDRVQGGQDCISIEMDPGIATLMRDIGRGMGLGLSEFAKQVLEDSYVNSYLETCELKPLFFKPAEWKALTELVNCNRIPSGAALLTIIRELRPQDGDLKSQSTVTIAPAV